MAGRITRVDTPTSWVKATGSKGQDALIMASQAPGYSSQQQYTYNTVVPSTVPPTFLTQGQPIFVNIIDDAMGLINRIWVKLVVSVANAPVTLLPPVMWLETINSYRDASASNGKVTSWINTLFGLSNYFPSQFTSLADGMQLNARDAWSTEPFPVGLTTVYIPLENSTLLVDGFLGFYPPNIRLEFVSPQAGCIEQGTPANVTLSSLSVILEEVVLNPDKLKTLASYYGNNVISRSFLQWTKYDTPQTVSDGQTLRFIMTNVKGVVPFIAFAFQTTTDYSSNTGAGRKRFVPLGGPGATTTVQYYTTNGTPVFKQPIDLYLQRTMISGTGSYGDLLETGWPGINFIDFTNDRSRSLAGQIGSGYRIIQPQEYIDFNFPPYTAEVARVTTFNTVDGTGANVAATAGSYQLQYTNGNGQSFISSMIAATASAAEVQTAVNGMGIMGGCVATVGATNLNSTTGLSLTLTKLTRFDTPASGARWSVMSFGLRSNALLGIMMADVGGTVQVGIAPGNYILWIWAPCFYIMDLSRRVMDYQQMTRGSGGDVMI